VREAELLAERRRPPALLGADAFAAAHADAGSDGYRRVLLETMRAEAAAIETRLVERHPTTVNDIYSPPIVRLVSLYAQLGDRKRAREWQLQGMAERPALARWFASIPELRVPAGAELRSSR
jgi:hypothetical protein